MSYPQPWQLEPVSYTHLDVYKRQDQLNNIRDAVSVLGVIVIGALIPSLVKVTTPLAITVGDATQTIQSILDGILPALLPCLVTAMTYFGLTKIRCV